MSRMLRIIFSFLIIINLTIIKVSGNIIYMSRMQHGIWTVNPDGSGSKFLFQGADQVSALGVDSKNSKIWYAWYGGRPDLILAPGCFMLSKSNLDGSSVEDIASYSDYPYVQDIDAEDGVLCISAPGLMSISSALQYNPPNGYVSPIALDDINNKAYYIDISYYSGQYRLVCVDFNASKKTVLKQIPNDFANDIYDMEISGNKLYMSRLNWGIWTSNLDGSNRQFFCQGTNQAQALAIDSVNSKLYWIDCTPGTNSSYRIMRINLNGSNKQEVFHDGKIIYDIDIHFDLAPNEDADGDGLLNGWEMNGIDENDDGTIDLDLPALGADPRHKDLFVEVDAMTGRAPTQTNINQIVKAFANAPVSNPDGVDGITLHIQLDETNIPLDDWDKAFDDFDKVKKERFGTPSEHSSTNSNRTNILKAKKKVYRYCIFAKRYWSEKFQTWDSSGLAELYGNDFMITLGNYNTSHNRIATFMHEFGHNLNLQHGGSDDINYKPNYHSIMNYHWQFEHLSQDGWELDYSRQALPTLNESDLDERDGIGGSADAEVPVGPVPINVVNEKGPIDWNRDGDTKDSGVKEDINYVGKEDGGPSPGQILTGYNDWPNILYKIGNTGNFADGIHLLDTMHPEMTNDEIREICETIDGIYFDLNEPNTLKIENFVKYFYTDPNEPHANQGILTYVEKAGNFNEIDSNDIFYSNMETTSSKIVSLIPVWNIEGEIIDYNSLSKDYRPFPIDPNDPNSDVLIELSVFNPEPNDPNINSENYLKFLLPNNAFLGKTISIQQLSTDPNVDYPVWDIRNIVKKNNRKLPLDYIVTDSNQAPAEPNISIDLNVPYAWFVLSTNREIIDINDDWIIDYNDYSLLLTDFGKEGIYRTDIASSRNKAIILGIPDGKVDETDEKAFITEYNKKYPDDPIPNPYESQFGDFESVQIEEPFTTFGDSPWIISDDSYKGNYSAKSGNISHNQSSILETTIDVTEGNISFWRKVSCEQGFYDKLIFYIDNVATEAWSGILDWEQMSYQVAPGTHTLKWEYQKDGSTSVGEDSAWIDDIVIQ